MKNSSWLERHPRLEKFPIPAPVLVLVLFLSAILVASYFASGSNTPVPCAMAVPMTGMSPTTATACNCIPEDISVSLGKMAQATKLLTDQLAIAEAREVETYVELVNARAEIERLKAENDKFRELTTTLGEIIVR